MKYLFSYRESIFYDDAVTMARYQLFDATTAMSFYFNDDSFTDVKDIKILIDKYNEFYIKENSWAGGPPPNGFIKFFNDNFSTSESNIVCKNWVLPQDYVNYCRISVVEYDSNTGSYRLRPLDINNKINTAIGYLQDDQGETTKL